MINSEQNSECFYQETVLFKKRATKNKRKSHKHEGHQEANRKWTHNDKIKKKQRTLKRKSGREDKLNRGKYQQSNLPYSYEHDTNEDCFSQTQTQDNQYFMNESQYEEYNYDEDYYYDQCDYYDQYDYYDQDDYEDYYGYDYYDDDYYYDYCRSRDYYNRYDDDYYNNPPFRYQGLAFGQYGDSSYPWWNPTGLNTWQRLMHDFD